MFRLFKNFNIKSETETLFLRLLNKRNNKKINNN